MIGYLHGGRAERNKGGIAALRRGLAEAGYVEGQNVAIEPRWANLQFSQLSKLAADLVEREVALIVTAGGYGAVLAAKEATSTIPIVSANGLDLVRYGFVSSLSRPGGNITGITTLAADLGNKRLELMHQLLPSITTVGYLSSNATDPVSVDQRNEMIAAGRTIGVEVVLFQAGNDRDFAERFNLIKLQAGAVIVGAYGTLSDHRNRILTLAARHKIPVMCPDAGWARAGGLISYGTNIQNMYAQVGRQYVARILNGTKPADLPVQLPTRFELVVNLKTAKRLKVEIPPQLLAVADEVIE